MGVWILNPDCLGFNLLCKISCMPSFDHDLYKESYRGDDAFRFFL